MTPFQWVAIGLLTLLLLWELIRLLRTPRAGLIRLIRCFTWATAAVAIARPHWLQSLANLVGIQRGADLVSYSFILLFIVATFFFYARNVRLQRQLTEIVRHIAIQEARRGDAQAVKRADG